MKILILIKCWKGGVGGVMRSIIPILQKKGHQVEVISREDDLNIFSMKNSFFPLRRLIKEKEYDILYTQDWSLAIPFLSYKKHYCCFHGLNLKHQGKPFQYIVGKIMGKKLIAVGPPVKKKFKKAHLVNNGVDLNKFFPINNQRQFIGYIKKKSEEKATYELAKKLSEGLNKEISIAENIPFDKMNEWYNSLDTFISFPNKRAGFNLCWLEAMVSGVPKIIGNYGGIGSEIPITKLGEEVKRIDYRTWLINSNFTWENHVNKLLEIFR